MAFFWFFLGIAVVAWGLRRIKHLGFETSEAMHTKQSVAHDSEHA